MKEDRKSFIRISHKRWELKNNLTYNGRYNPFPLTIPSSDGWVLLVEFILLYAVQISSSVCGFFLLFFPRVSETLQKGRVMVAGDKGSR